MKTPVASKTPVSTAYLNVRSSLNGRITCPANCQSRAPKKTYVRALAQLSTLEDKIHWLSNTMREITFVIATKKVVRIKENNRSKKLNMPSFPAIPMVATMGEVDTKEPRTEDSRPEFVERRSSSDDRGKTFVNTLIVRSFFISERRVVAPASEKSVSNEARGVAIFPL